MINWLLGKNNREPRYRLYDSWQPDFDNELRLAVSSFSGDESFHRAFGSGMRVSESAIMWNFIDLVLRFRYNPVRHIVTVRKDRDFQAMITGCIDCGEANSKEMVASFQANTLPVKIRRVEDVDRHCQRHLDYARSYAAAPDDEFMARSWRYHELLQNLRSENDTAPIHFSIHMIAVSPGEQGRGHVRAMLDRLVQRFEKVPAVEHIQVSTYDESKVELYQHLGFGSVEEVSNGDLKAWQLTMPLPGCSLGLQDQFNRIDL